ncbi:MAG TPA: prepilin-type N-terminal cleavage/methylation domain-containing protein [Verrucomicrobiae bacterium]|nr:prepilin-type N-terminal cleavage/methylation domain-containing protein [Verrucomicrobiae bacterium]
MKALTRRATKNGFTLLECMVAMAVLSLGILSLVSVFTQGLKNSAQAQIQFIAQQKAREAMETIFTARNTQILTWGQIKNVSQGGVFTDGPQSLCDPGPDGLYGTADDNCAIVASIIVGPGPDKIFGTSDDQAIPLNPWMKRTITITPDPNIANLNRITVTITWTYEGQAGSFSVNSFISNYS